MEILIRSQNEPGFTITKMVERGQFYTANIATLTARTVNYGTDSAEVDVEFTDAVALLASGTGGSASTNSTIFSVGARINSLWSDPDNSFATIGILMDGTPQNFRRGLIVDVTGIERLMVQGVQNTCATFASASVTDANLYYHFDYKRGQ